VDQKLVAVRTTAHPASRNRLRHKVYVALRDDILNLRLGPGAILTEGALAARFHVSRTPVREALSLLNMERLVESDSSGFLRVAEISVKSVRELYELLQALEGYAARLATMRGTETQAAKIEQALQEMEAAAQEGDFARWAPADIRLHTIILEAAQNQSLLRTVTSTRDEVNRMRVFLSRRPQRMTKSTAQHLKIVDAMRAGDAEVAEQLMRDHLRDYAAELIAGLEDYEMIRGQR
jgi:DNA-binding GntR family transcriptional regulator